MREREEGSSFGSSLTRPMSVCMLSMSCTDITVMGGANRETSIQNGGTSDPEKSVHRTACVRGCVCVRVCTF